MAMISKDNALQYLELHGKSIEVLRRANGNNRYTIIAEELQIHPTTVSGLLKKAAYLGLAKKLGTGIYKRSPGALGSIPRKSAVKNKNTNSVPDIINKITKRKKRKRLSTSRSGLSVSNRIVIKMDKMVQAYKDLYSVENVLRELIRKVLGHKSDWWKDRVPGDVQKSVTQTKAQAPYHAPTRNDELEYTHLGQLKEIIINKKNWNEFNPYLKTNDKNDFSATINKGIPSRNAVGHCIPLNTEDLKYVDIRFKDILKMIK